MIFRRWSSLQENRCRTYFRHGDVRFDARARARFGGDGEFPTDQEKSFAHADQSEPGSCLGGVREAYSVVGDAEIEGFGSSTQLGIDRANQL